MLQGLGWAVLMALATQPCARADSLGARLFEGTETLQARAYRSGVALGPAANRCANCHESAGGGRVSDARSQSVTAERIRIPASLHVSPYPLGRKRQAYDIRTLCTFLQTGVTPEGIMLTEAMPRYVVDEFQCAALLRHLSSAARKLR
jgi:hypothetical protein